MASSSLSPDPTLIPTIHNLQHAQSLKCVWALEELALAKGLKYHIKNYPRTRGQNPDLAKISPMGKAPILTLESPDGRPVPNYQVGPGVIMESRLILQFISDTWADGLWTPKSDEDRKRDIYFQEFAMNSLGPRSDQALIFGVIPVLMPFPLRQILGLLFGPLEKTFIGFLEPHLTHMEENLSDAKPWFAGENIGLADFCMSWPMDVAVQRKFFDPARFPKVAKWHDTVLNRPAYKNAVSNGGGPANFNLVTFQVKS
jgi:glutathione S-transferase